MSTLSILSDFFSSKKVLLLGYGREGKSSHALLNTINTHALLGVADSRTEVDLLSGNISKHLGNDYLSSIKDYDIVLKSPGIPLQEEIWTQYEDKLTSQVELFLSHYKGTCIGITGTKGKTTSTGILASICRSDRRKTHVVGNIGVPIFEVLDDINTKDTVVLELSSHQLHHCKASPPFALFLNLYQEHLDYYDSFKEYQEAKKNIFRFQDSSNIAVANEDLLPIFESTFQNKNISYFNLSTEVPFLRSDFSHLPGDHLYSNLIGIYKIAKQLGISTDTIIEGINKFTLDTHRLEQVGKKKGITFINDSAATIPEATIAAIDTFPNTKSVIIGGFDRGVNLGILEKSVITLENIQFIFIPETGHQIYNQLHAKGIATDRIHLAKDIAQAITIAETVTPKNSTCLFSPAAASYHKFANYQQRGDMFKELIHALDE